VRRTLHKQSENVFTILGSTQEENKGHLADEMHLSDPLLEAIQFIPGNRGGLIGLTGLTGA